MTNLQLTDATHATAFDLADTPLLSQGRTDDQVVAADGMVGRVKVYASGGENSTHAHVSEDHLFLVLAGRARFHLDRDGRREVEVGTNAGVFVPAGAFYRFESVGDTNLVLFRVGSAKHGAAARIGADGQPLVGHSTANHYTEPVVVPGATLGRM